MEIHLDLSRKYNGAFSAALRDYLKREERTASWVARKLSLSPDIICCYLRELRGIRAIRKQQIIDALDDRFLEDFKRYQQETDAETTAKEKEITSAA